MPLTMDVFETDAFSLTTLTQMVNEQPFVPGRLGAMGMFDEDGVTTTDIAIERMQGQLNIIPITARGAPATPHTTDKRKIHKVEIPRLAKRDTINASEVQNVRSFGTTSELKTLQGEVAKRQREMSRDLDATLERHRLGAMRGQILDADDSVHLDLFLLFDVSPPAAHSFKLDVSTTKVRTITSQLIRRIEDTMGAGSTDMTIHAMVDDLFFDALVDHDDVRKVWDNSERNVNMQQRTARRTLFYGGVLFEEYRTPAGWQAPGHGFAFPTGVPGIYITRFAPGESWDVVNTPGLPRYSFMTGDPTGENSYRVVHVRSYPISLITRPTLVIPLLRQDGDA